MVFLVSDLPSLLLEAVKRYRPVPCAIGVAGVDAAAAIVYTALKEDSRSAANRAAIMLGFMVVLLVFASLMRTKSTTYVMRAFLMMWVMVACFCPIFVQLSSFIFRWPTVNLAPASLWSARKAEEKAAERACRTVQQINASSRIGVPLSSKAARLMTGKG